MCYLDYRIRQSDTDRARIQELVVVTLPQIEHMLGREVTGSEVVEVDSFADLNPEQRKIFEFLAERQLAVCALYLKWVCKMELSEAQVVIDEWLTK